MSKIVNKKLVHSDHKPALYGKTLIWNIDKDNPLTTAEDALDKKAFAVAELINEGTIQACHYAHDIFRPSCPLKIFA